MYQQSVTLTAKMSYRNEGGQESDWAWSQWGVGADFLPLLVGVCSAIAVVLLALSALVLWRCCLLPRRKHHYCNGVFCEVPPQQFDASKSPRDTTVFAMRNGPWAFHSRVLTSSNDSLYAIPRSQTITAFSTRSCDVHGRQATVASDGRLITKHLTMMMPAVSASSASSTYIREVSPSSSLHALDGVHYAEQLGYQHRAKSTPTLEDDLYAQVNFSKKRKNRMGKDDAAVIALSKSGTHLELDTDTPHVVYNERTAL